MKHLGKKAAATALIVTMGLTVVPAPAFAVSSNIVAETENVNKLTVSQIQDLAAIYNKTAQDLKLKMDSLELSEMQLRNARRSAESAIDDLYDMKDALSNSPNLSDIYKQAAADRGKELLQPDENGMPTNMVDVTKDSQIIAWGAQAQAAAASEKSNAQQMNSAIDQAYDGLLTIDNNLKTLSEGKDDLNKAISDLESQMRYSSAYMALQLTYLDKTLELMKEQIDLQERAVKIGELQKKLGMNTSVDVETTRANLKNAQNQLASLQVTRDGLARSINSLIGRNVDTPLEVVPMDLPVAIEKAPPLTAELRQKFVDGNYKLKTLERDKDHLVSDSKDSGLGSDEKQQIQYKIDSKTTEITNQKDTIIDDLRSLLNNIDSSAEAYRLSNYQLTTEKKNASYAEKRYQLGMISQLSKLGSDLSLKSAELTNLQNANNYYLAWLKYNYANKGIDVSVLP